MFYVEILDGTPVKNIQILGCIVRFFLSAEEGLNFAQRYKFTNILPEEIGINIEILLAAPANQENLKELFERFEDKDFNKELQQDLLKEFEDFTNTPSIDYLIHLIQDYIYFFDPAVIANKKNLLKDAMPVYMDFITQVEIIGMNWPETMEVRGTKLKASKVLRTLNNSTTHIDDILKPILTLLHKYQDYEISIENLISKLKEYLDLASKNPFPDFENFFPALHNELSENTLFSGNQLNELYSIVAAHFLGTLELKFESKYLAKPKTSTDSINQSGYDIELKKCIQNKFKSVQEHSKLLSPLSLAKANNFISESKESENMSSPQKFKRFSPQVNWKTRSLLPRSEELEKIAIKLDFSDQPVIPETNQADVSKISKRPFFANPKPNSCFKREHIDQIKSHIGQLEKEIKSGSFFYEARKTQKKLGLEQLIENSYKPGITIVEAIDDVEKSFSELRAGLFSNRTGNLLDELLEYEGVVTSCCWG
jgi:hypothetical protein